MIKDNVAFNHHPLQRGVRFVYNGWRYKCKYDITLYDGTQYIGCYPNGDAWHTQDIDVRRVADKDVQYIQFTADADLNKFERWTCENRRAAFILDGWDDKLIPTVTTVDGKLVFTPKLVEE